MKVSDEHRGNEKLIDLKRIVMGWKIEGNNDGEKSSNVAKLSFQNGQGCLEASTMQTSKARSEMKEGVKSDDNEQKDDRSCQC